MNRTERQALDRHIAGGEDSIAEFGVLSEECDAELCRADMYSQPDAISKEWASVRNEEGAHLFFCSRSIGLLDLRAILAFGSKQYRRGQADGKRLIQHQLRTLLDVPANPAEPV